MIALSDLTPKQCRYVVSDPTEDAPALFCGEDAEAGSDYCAEHAADIPEIGEA